MCATIANITDEDVLHCFQNGLMVKHVYHDFGRNHPRTTVELHDMMQRWADQEDDENKRFPKRKPDDLVAVVERNPHGKKSGNQQV
jgi:hypothetical protein